MRILGNVKSDIEDDGEVWTQDIEIIRNTKFNSVLNDADEFSIGIGTQFYIENIGLVEVKDITTRFVHKDIDHRNYGINMKWDRRGIPLEFIGDIQSQKNLMWTAINRSN